MDTVLLALASLVVVASLVAYYYFDARRWWFGRSESWSSLGVGAALLYRTQLGQFLWQFIQGSRGEIRKVVWPTRQETTQDDAGCVLLYAGHGRIFLESSISCCC